MTKKISILFGVIFIVAGIWGFVSSPVLGLFGFGTVGNVVHIIVGLILLAVASKSSDVTALKTLGIVYLVFFVLSLLSITFFGDKTSGWLYFILGAVMLILSLSQKKHIIESAPQV